MPLVNVEVRKAVRVIIKKNKIKTCCIHSTTKISLFKSGETPLL